MNISLQNNETKTLICAWLTVKNGDQCNAKNVVVECDG